MARGEGQRENRVESLKREVSAKTLKSLTVSSRKGRIGDVGIKDKRKESLWEI